MAAAGSQHVHKHTQCQCWTLPSTHLKHGLFSEISNAGAVKRALTQQPWVPRMPIPVYGTVLLFIPKPCSLGKSEWSDQLSSKQLMWTETSVKLDQASSKRLGKWTDLLWVLGCFGGGWVAMERASLRRGPWWTPRICSNMMRWPSTIHAIELVHSKPHLDKSLVHHIHVWAPGSHKAQAPSWNLSNSLHTCCGITHSTCLGSPGTWPPEAAASVWTSRRHKQITDILNFHPRKENVSWEEGRRMRLHPLKSWWTLSTSIIFYSSDCDGQYNSLLGNYLS